MPYQETLQKTISTNARTKPSSPQVEIQNPFPYDIFVNLFDCMPESNFSTKGKLDILINDVSIYDQQASDTLKRVKKLPLLSGGSKILKGDNSIKIFAWNVEDDAFIDVDFSINLGITENPIASSIVPLSQDELDNAVSDKIELFPFQVYSNGQNPTKIFNTTGKRKMIITMSASTILPITHPTSASGVSGSLEWRMYWVLCTGIVTEGVTTETFNNFDTFDIYDLQYSRNQSIDFTISSPDTPQFPLTSSRTVHRPDDACNGASNADGSNNQENLRANKTILIDVLESDDINFMTGVTTLFSNKTRAQLDALTPIATTKRYLKLLQHITNVTFEQYVVSSSHQNGLGHFPSDETVTTPYTITPLTFSNFLDLLTQGGQAALSFEVLGSGGQWFEIISSGELGTVTQGQKIQKQIGDVVSRSSVDKVGFILPASQTDLRALLTVTNSIETGVTIFMVK